MFAPVIFAVLTASATASSDCPDARPVEYFNITAYSGKWFEAARYSTGLNSVEKCYWYECTVEDNKAFLDAIYLFDGHPGSLETVVTYADDTQSGNTTAKMIMTQNGKTYSFEYNSSVLLVDYHQYAIVFACYFDKKSQSNKQLLWIHSRNRKLEGKAKTEVENYMKSTGFLDWDKLVWIDNSEEGCIYYH